MNVQLLVCVRCGGPLGKIEAVPAVIECEFCAAVISVGHGAPVITRESTVDAKRDADRKAARLAFIAEIDSLAKAKRDPFDALCEAAAKHLGAAGQTQTFARIVFAIAVDFEAESGASIRRDGMALNRIADGYLRALDDLRNSPTCELNLPFLTATSSGPKHLKHALSPAILGELAQREPGVAAIAAAPPAPVAPPDSPPPPKKKSWWPF